MGVRDREMWRGIRDLEMSLGIRDLEMSLGIILSRETWRDIQGQAI